MKYKSIKGDIMEKEILFKALAYIDIEGLVGEFVLEELVYGRMDELVASSENTLDNALAEILKPQLKVLLVAYLKEMIEKAQAPAEAPAQ